MEQNPQTSPPPTAQANKVFFALAGVFVFIILASVTASGWFMIAKPQMPWQRTPPAPTPPCVEPSIAVGPATFRVESLSHTAGSPLAAPDGKPDTAYWVSGTGSNYLFVLSPTAENQALGAALKAGTPVVIRWGDCSTEGFAIVSTGFEKSDDPSLFDPSAAGFNLFIPGGSSDLGMVIHAVRPEVKVLPTPTAAENETRAEVEFLDTAASPDGKSVRLSIAVKNLGVSPITLKADMISLTPENGPSLAPSSVEPALPQEIQPGERNEFIIIFPHPGVNTAVFKILDFNVDLYF